jgi:multimeric flavodoxin WrbA
MKEDQMVSKNIKITGIISSSNYNGNSATLLREALKGAETEGATVTEIFLPKYKIEFCTGCMKCMETKCPFHDDFEALKKIMYESDGIIWSSPTFAASPNSIMKRFIERFGLSGYIASTLGGKYMAGISTAGSMGARNVARNLANISRDCVFQRGYVSGSLGVGLNGVSIEGNQKALRKARQLGRKVCIDIKTANKYPFQNLIRRSINRLFIKPKFLKIILQKKSSNMKAVYETLAAKGLI